MEKKYSLWLIPDGNIYEKFAGIISRLSEEYNSVKFEPHVTLIGGLTGTEEELLRRTDLLVNSIKPLKIKLERTDCFPERHKALLIRAKKTDELMEANKKATETFNLPEDSGYMPHLSLFYGDLVLETKEKIIEDLGREFSDEFTIKSICFYFTTGEEEKWRKIKEVPLV